MDPIINDRCVKMARLTRSADSKTSRFCLPCLLAQGRVFLTTLSAVVATSGCIIRIRNTAVTENSAQIGGGSFGRLVLCLSGPGRKWHLSGSDSGSDSGFEPRYPYDGVVPVEPPLKIHGADVLLRLLSYSEGAHVTTRCAWQ